MQLGSELEDDDWVDLAHWYYRASQLDRGLDEITSPAAADQLRKKVGEVQGHVEPHARRDNYRRSISLPRRIGRAITRRRLPF